MELTTKQLITLARLTKNRPGTHETHRAGADRWEIGETNVEGVVCLYEYPPNPHITETVEVLVAADGKALALGDEKTKVL